MRGGRGQSMAEARLAGWFCLQWGVWVTHLLLGGRGIALSSCCLCWRRAALPVAGQGPRALPSVLLPWATWAESALVLPVSALVLTARAGRYFELVWLHSQWTLHLIVRAARPSLSHRYPPGYHQGLESMSGLPLGTLSSSCTCWTSVSPAG